MPAKHARILVIDDDPLFRSLVTSLLRNECIVAVASEGSEGFVKAVRHVPDVAIIDINMHGWDGIKTLKTFRAHPTLQDVRIIMLTADTSKETVLAAIQSGANDYLIKASFSKQELYRKLNRLIPDGKNKLTTQTIVEPLNVSSNTPPSTSSNVSPNASSSTSSNVSSNASSNAMGQAESRNLTSTVTDDPGSLQPVVAADLTDDDDDALQQILDAWE